MDLLLAGAKALRRAVAASHGLRSGAKNPNRCRIVDTATECVFNGFRIRFVVVSDELCPVRQPALQIIHESHVALAVPASDKVGDDRLAVGINGRPGQSVADVERNQLGRRNAIACQD